MATGYEVTAYRDLSALRRAVEEQAAASERIATALEALIPLIGRLASASEASVA